MRPNDKLSVYDKMKVSKVLAGVNIRTGHTSNDKGGVTAAMEDATRGVSCWRLGSLKAGLSSPQRQMSSFLPKWPFRMLRSIYHREGDWKLAICRKRMRKQERGETLCKPS